MFEKAPFAAAIEALNPPHDSAWTTLVAVSRGDASTEPMRTYLKDIRNRGTFHYRYWDRLLAGYRAAFQADTKTEQNSRAFLSAGPL